MLSPISVFLFNTKAISSSKSNCFEAPKSVFCISGFHLTFWSVKINSQKPRLTKRDRDNLPVNVSNSGAMHLQGHKHFSHIGSVFYCCKNLCNSVREVASSFVLYPSNHRNILLWFFVMRQR